MARPPRGGRKNSTSGKHIGSNASAHHAEAATPTAGKRITPSLSAIRLSSSSTPEIAEIGLESKVGGGQLA